MFFKLCTLLLVALPASAFASSYYITKVESILSWGHWSIFIGSILGGIAAMFIKTEVDNQLAYPLVAKLLIGIGLGYFSCVSFIGYYPETVVIKLALPSFVLGCLGAPIMVFLLTWFTDKDTVKGMKKKMNKQLGIENEETQCHEEENNK